MKLNYLYLFMVIVALAGCSTVPVITVVKTTIPQALLTCQEAPTVPVKPSARELATFILDEREASTDCREKLAQVKAFEAKAIAAK